MRYKYLFNWVLGDGQTGSNEVTLEAPVEKEHYPQIVKALEKTLDDQFRAEVGAEEEAILVHTPWELKITNVELLEEIPVDQD